MQKYLPLLLFIGLAFWGCEEKSEETIIGDWSYSYTEYNISEMLDNDLLNTLDSFKESSHQNRLGLIISFSNDSVFVNDDNFLYSLSNDSLFIKDWINWEYELSADELTLSIQIIWTDENGDSLPTYRDLMILERL
jgi:hypothetical protein|tara:strand:+ start:78 stop:485 length:408 start_codon:yes stop_codon:yes gene_type:complete